MLDCTTSYVYTFALTSFTTLVHTKTYPPTHTTSVVTFTDQLRILELAKQLQKIAGREKLTV